MATTKTTFLLVPGAWHTTAYLQPLAAALTEKGYTVETIELPTVNANPPVSSGRVDADAIESRLVSLLDGGRDVIVVAHSYAGIPTGDAVGRLIHKRGNKGPGRLKHLVFVAALIALEGQNGPQVHTGSPANIPLEFIENFLLGKEHNSGYTPSMNDPKNTFYGDVPEPEASRYVSLLGTQSSAAFAAVAEFAGWRNVPSTYIITDKDNSLPLIVQEFMVQKARDSYVVGRDDYKAFSGELGTTHLDSSHSPFLSKKEEMVAVLEQVNSLSE